MQTAATQHNHFPPFTPPHYTVREAAKILGQGEKKLFAWLRTHGVLDKQNQPYQRYIAQKYFVVHGSKYLNVTTQRLHYYSRTDITPAGLDWLRKQLVIERHD